MGGPSKLGTKECPNALIIYDKFQIMSHLSKAFDRVRRDEYKRLSGKDLKKLLDANRWLNTDYLLKELFGHLWGYKTIRGVRVLFE